ncbi:MAG: toll/interleukin-1 receptor domain-containing protein [Microthrixaceae bacterium]
MSHDRPQVFLSHNSADKSHARLLGPPLQLVADVWFDEWGVRAGDSVTGWMSEALEAFDIFVLMWSVDAEASYWVQREYRSAIASAIKDPKRRVVPVALDDTPLPAILNDLRYISFDPSNVAGMVDDIMGFATEKARRIAIQEGLQELSWSGPVMDVPGYGPIVGCPSCGAELDAIEGWSQVDHVRDDTYAGARCKECGWEDGGEI